MADIADLTGSEDLAAVRTKVSEIISFVNALKTTSDTNETTVSGHTEKIAEIYDNISLPSEEPAAEVAPEIPETEMAVTISAVPRTFTFNVAKFNFNSVNYISSDVADLVGDNDADAIQLIKDLVESGSVVIEGEGSGILTETTE